jgi:hypothetical protein
MEVGVARLAGRIVGAVVTVKESLEIVVGVLDGDGVLTREDVVTAALGGESV